MHDLNKATLITDFTNFSNYTFLERCYSHIKNLCGSDSTLSIQCHVFKNCILLGCEM